MIRVMLADGELRRYSFIHAIKYLIVKGEQVYFDTMRYRYDHPDCRVASFLIKRRRLSKLQQHLIYLHRTRVFCSSTVLPYPIESNSVKLAVLQALDRLPKPMSWPIEYYESEENRIHSYSPLFGNPYIQLFKRNSLG